MELFQVLLQKANRYYATAKADKTRSIASDQVLSVLEVLAEALESADANMRRLDERITELECNER